MTMMEPGTPEELATALREAAEAGQTIQLGGAFSKNAMGGRVVDAAVQITTGLMRRVRQYEPRDLTISVEAGMPWCELEALLAGNGQMVPLDPPLRQKATVGGVLAANCSGPRRRLYGTARDVVIGMTFATMEGKLVRCGGMVVKNVAGLDMAKLMIGSMGTLAAIAVVNFKLAPAPAGSLTFVGEFADAEGAFAARDVMLKGVLQPAAMDVLNPEAARRCGRSGWVLALRAGGSDAVLSRYRRDLQGLEGLEGAAEHKFWEAVEEFTPRFLAEHPDGAMVRGSCQLQEIRGVVESMPGAVVCRAGNGVLYGHFSTTAVAEVWMQKTGSLCVMEYGQSTGERWPRPGGDLATMRKIKAMLDPKNLLNPGRLYGRI
jgi:glycolate oxidase FAD binding subunit